MIRLQERTTELFSAPSASLPSRLRHFVSWLDSDAFFRTTLATLPDPGIDAEEWITENIKWNQGVQFPADESAAVGCCWLVTRYVAATDDVDSTIFGITHQWVIRGGGQDDANRSFLEVFVDPILGWLKERILTDDRVLHSLHRYAREASWFRREHLRTAYENDTTIGEATLDSDLRHHLFRDGIDFPFSQVRGPSGRPDIVVPDDEAEPLPLEIKVYDPPRNRDDAWVRSGFVQAIEYAHDYRRVDGYLAVFDVTDDGLAVAGDVPDSHIPYVRSSGVTVFIVAIPIGPPRAASQRRRVRRRTLDSAFLTESL